MNNSKNITLWTISCVVALGALTGCGSAPLEPLPDEVVFTLSWPEPSADLDLVVIEPDGSVASREFWGTNCRFGWDHFEGPAVERVICRQPQSGEYRAEAHCWEGASEFLLRVDEGQGPFELGRGVLNDHEEMRFLHALLGP